MKKDEHTPGQWSVEHETKIIAAEGQRIGWDDTLSINFVAGEANANTILMAAAPDLLAACEMALGYFDSSYEPAEREQLRAAIKKARGTP